MFDTTSSKATVDQSITMPDYFSCNNCHGRAAISYCRELREANLCAKEMLREALCSGAVQVVLYLPAGGAR